jgi:hypothetical protein
MQISLKSADLSALVLRILADGEPRAPREIYQPSFRIHPRPLLGLVRAGLVAPLNAASPPRATCT